MVYSMLAIRLMVYSMVAIRLMVYSMVAIRANDLCLYEVGQPVGCCTALVVVTAKRQWI